MRRARSLGHIDLERGVSAAMSASLPGGAVTDAVEASGMTRMQQQRAGMMQIANEAAAAAQQAQGWGWGEPARG